MRLARLRAAARPTRRASMTAVTSTSTILVDRDDGGAMDALPVDARTRRRARRSSWSRRSSGSARTSARSPNDSPRLGYLVGAPDVFWRFAPGWEAGHDEAGLHDVDREGAAARLPARRSATASPRSSVLGAPRRGSPARPGVMGFCIGGTLAWGVAVEGEPAVCVSYYGSGVPSMIDQIDRVDVPDAVPLRQRRRRSCRTRASMRSPRRSPGGRGSCSTSRTPAMRSTTTRARCSTTRPPRTPPGRRPSRSSATTSGRLSAQRERRRRGRQPTATRKSSSATVTSSAAPAGSSGRTGQDHRAVQLGQRRREAGDRRRPHTVGPSCRRRRTAPAPRSPAEERDRSSQSRSTLR